ncbi:MAG: hypothetical protein WC262_10710 [Bacteroidales bacterium]|jgi:hypothetical protein
MRDYSLPIIIGFCSFMVVLGLALSPLDMEPGPGWEQWQTNHENACIECLDRNGFPNWTYGDWDNISPYMQKVCPCCKPLTLESQAYGCED